MNTFFIVDNIPNNISDEYWRQIDFFIDHNNCENKEDQRIGIPCNECIFSENCFSEQSNRDWRVEKAKKILLKRKMKDYLNKFEG